MKIGAWNVEPVALASILVALLLFLLVVFTTFADTSKLK